jgi:hypothetical protein
MRGQKTMNKQKRIKVETRFRNSAGFEAPEMKTDPE